MTTSEAKMKRKTENSNSLISCLAMVAAAFMVISFVAVAPVGAREYTLDADFDEGDLVGVEHETVHDQLQLSKEAVTLPFIWVPNNNGTVSKVDTETGDELGRYCVAPHNASPSRTTVDLDGSCWVGLRQAGTVVKIGLFEAGQWIDRNGNGTCETSQDTNGDGDITGAELLPWGQDECVLYEVVLIPGSEGTYAPGTYPGVYDYGHWSTSPRGLAIDAGNNLWAGTSTGSRKYYYIDGSNGAILKSIDVSSWGHSAYGAVIDAYGILWCSGNPGPDIRIDPSTDTVTTWSAEHFVYGIGLDYLDHLFCSGWTSRYLSRVDITTGIVDPSWPQYKSELDYARGLVCTSDNDVWVAETHYYGRVHRYDNAGNHKAAIDIGSATGVAVDAAGKVWACNLNDEYIKRIDPATDTVDLSKRIIGSGGHYSYSDMTGIISRTITTKIGTWTVDHDSGSTGTPWGTVSWYSSEPTGTSVTVKARSSDDGSTWSAWEAAGNGVDLSATPDGQYIQIEATLQITSGDVSPILYDLTIEPAIIAVDIDIKPGSFPNSINLGNNGVIPVAVLTTDDFDATTVMPTTVGFGPWDASAVHWAVEDVDGDGDIDMIFHFKTQETGISEGDTEASLIGWTTGGIRICGTDSVRIVPPKGKKK